MTESQGSATITVQRVGGSKGTVSVQYDTIDGTARAGSDYTAVSGTMVFEPGEAAKTFKIPVTADNTSEGEEDVNLNLGNVLGNAPLVTPFIATLKIQ